ncbi:MAG: hypothetical protein ACREMQ_15370 [Longimicrobiales bacterium]
MPCALILACTRGPARAAPNVESTAARPSANASAVTPSIERDLERVRAATSAFQNIAAAHAAGFPTTVPRCLANASLGGMGHHFVNRTLLDDRLDVEHPEILLYAPTSDGQLKLVAVEYIIPLAEWKRQQAPRIFGQRLKRSEELQLWYLHVWAWEQNSAGLFADWNPAVKC